MSEVESGTICIKILCCGDVIPSLSTWAMVCGRAWETSGTLRTRRFCKNKMDLYIMKFFNRKIQKEFIARHHISTGDESGHDPQVTELIDFALLASSHYQSWIQGWPQDIAAAWGKGWDGALSHSTSIHTRYWFATDLICPKCKW